MSFGQAGPIYLESGDILVIGTDGIWEAKNIENIMFGKDRLLELIRMHQGENAQALCSLVSDAVSTYTAPLSPDDDVTLVVIKVE